MKRVKSWLSDGRRVKIITPRVAPRPIDHPEQHTVEEIHACIENWCERHIGMAPEVTNAIDPGITEWWSNRSVPVEANTGKRLYIPREFV